MNNKRTIERIATIALAAFLVGYFVYQVAYGTKAIVLTAQSASANWIGGFNCFGEPRCVSGWDHAIVQAQTDWNSGLHKCFDCAFQGFMIEFGISCNWKSCSC